jgi:hypothetical protein
MAQLTSVARKESTFRLPEDVSFIDCDTHFLSMTALETLAKLYPSHFQLIVEEKIIKFLYEGRVIHRSRADDDILGSSAHGRLNLDTKVADMNKEDPKCVQVLGFDQGVLISHYPAGIGADVCRVFNDGVVNCWKNQYQDRFIPVAAIYWPWVEDAVKKSTACTPLGSRGFSYRDR